MTNSPKIKAVRIFCEWCADGVWSDWQIPGSTKEGFRVSDSLWQRIQDWQAWYHKQSPSFDMVDDPAFDVEGFIAEGYMIARAVKAELPDWTVHYVDEQLQFYALHHGLDWDIGRVRIESALH